jgi:hypothetical protein
MPPNIQFTSKDDVLEAYRRMKVPAWAIWCGKDLNFSYSGDNLSDGAAELAEYLEMISHVENVVYYKLCVYAGMFDDTITNKTPFTSSFTFRLSDAPTYGLARTGGIGGMADLTIKQYIDQRDATKLLLDEVKALRMEVKELQEGTGDEEDEIDDYGMGKIGRILQHPQVGPLAGQLVGAIVNMINRNTPAPDRVIAGVPGESEHDKIQAALKILCDAHPDFPDILVKLALMQQRQPVQLKFYIDSLRAMNI